MKVTFVTAINCMDGRVQEPVIKLLKQDFNCDSVDMITEPGPNLILAEGKEKHLIKSIKNRVDISINKHNSKLIAIIGHYDCAGNPKPKEEQLKEIKKSIKTINAWNYQVEVIGIWVDKNWKAERVF